MDKSLKLRKDLIDAGEKAVEELIKVAKESILKGDDSDDVDLAADKLKNAAASKKLAIFDAFDILARIQSEKEVIKSIENNEEEALSGSGFAERRSR
jgi:hypothetical protein